MPIALVMVSVNAPMKMASTVRVVRVLLRRVLPTAVVSMSVIFMRMLRSVRECTSRPSLMWIWRSQRAASSVSCVTTTRVMPLSLFKRNRMSSTKRPVTVSRLPVGSSAKMSLGLFTSARAITARCFWPPERLTALLLALSAISSWSSTAIPRARRSRRPTPAIFNGRMTFSRTLAFGLRKNCWKTNPKVSLRSRLSWRELRVAASTPPTRNVPWSG